MINQSDLAISKVIFRKIDFNRGDQFEGQRTANVQMSFSLGDIGIKRELDGIKVAFSLSAPDGDIVSFQVGGVLLVSFKRALTSHELQAAATYEFVVNQCVDSLIEIIASVSSRMGLTPIILDKSFLLKLVKTVTGNLDLKPVLDKLGLAGVGK